MLLTFQIEIFNANLHFVDASNKIKYGKVYSPSLTLSLIWFIIYLPIRQ